MPYKNTLQDDFNTSLDKVERSYIRIPTTIIFTIVFIIVFIVPIMIIHGVIGLWKGVEDWWVDFFVPCWKGPDKE